MRKNVFSASIFDVEKPRINVNLSQSRSVTPDSHKPSACSWHSHVLRSCFRLSRFCSLAIRHRPAKRMPSACLWLESLRASRRTLDSRFRRSHFNFNRYFVVFLILRASAGSASQAFRRVLANATSILFRVCENEGNGTRFAEIRVDSRIFSIFPQVGFTLPLLDNSQ